MEFYRVIKKGVGIDGKARRVGEIVREDQIGDTAHRFVQKGYIVVVDPIGIDRTNKPPVIEQRDSGDENVI